MRAAVAVAGAVLVVGLVGGCGGDEEPSSPSAPPTTTPADDGQVSLYDVVVGDCLRGLGEGRDLTVRLVDCDRPHQAEVYAEVRLAAEAFPGVDVLARRAATACAPRFAGYTGEAAGPGTEVAFVEVVPTVQSWASGDRSGLCLALGRDGTLLRGSIAAGGTPP